ncbi:spindle assembly checkpoint component [Carex rostrata]
MANESHKEFLFLIRDFSNQKTHGERRVSDLKKRMLDLTSDLESANSDLEVAKQSREMTDQELKGTQFQLAMTCASIQALEARVCSLHEDISRIGSELNVLKNKEDAEREGFKMKMLEINSRIRLVLLDNLFFFPVKFKLFLWQNSSYSLGFIINYSKAGDFTKSENNMMESEESLKDLEENLKCINAEMQMLEVEYEKRLNDHSEVSKELGNLRRKRILVEAIIEKSKILPELAGQTAELEREYASLGEELERKYACPSCGTNNMASIKNS